MILITGDIHAETSRFTKKNFPLGRELTSDDFVIICGDFGIWDEESDKSLLGFFSQKKYNVCFVCGNHENFKRLYSYPSVKWNGGMVHKIRDNIFHLQRGEVFEIEGKKIFTFGGASSHDIKDGILSPSDPDFRKKKKYYRKTRKSFRIDGISWWKEELPTLNEIENGRKNLKKHGYRVDYIISHCAPTNVQKSFDSGLYNIDVLTDFFQETAESTSFEKWYFGHYHDDRMIGEKYRMVYDDIIQI